MAATRVLVCSKIPGLCAAVERAVAGVGERVALQHREPEDLRPGGVHHHEWQAAQVLLCDPGMVASMVDDAQSLRWMQSTWAGVNAIFVESQKRDYALTRLGGCFGTQMAEYVIGYLLMHERRLLKATLDQKAQVRDILLDQKVQM